MGINKNINSLQSELARRTRSFLQKAKTQGFNIAIVEADRSQGVQNAYYAQGREELEAVNKKRAAVGLYLLSENENKKTVTQTLNSRHIGGNAVDIAPVRNGNYWWTAPQQMWEEIGVLAESCGLDWCAGGYGQTWGKGWDNPHFELMEN